MKTAFVFFTLNAVAGGQWEETLRSVSRQTRQPELLLVADSESNDETVALARKYDWEIWPVSRTEFNHGGTRDKVMRRLAEQGFEVAIFATQDIVLSRPDCLALLLDDLQKHDAAAVYGRHEPRNGGTFDHWQRKRCYPDSAIIKRREDIPKLGLITAFCSNTLCAWSIGKVLDSGSFPETEFGEDMLLAGKIILNGGAIGYCSSAVCFHDHSTHPVVLWRRGFLIGRMHKYNPWLSESFGKMEKCGKKQIDSSVFHWSVLPALLIKYSGYLAGRHLPSVLPWPIMIFFLIGLILLPMILFSDLPKSDVANRYAPMADAFREQRWEFAFHPRVPPFFPTLAGVLALLFGFDGFSACKTAASLMLALGVFPLWSATRKIYGRQVAILTLFLYAGCSYLLRQGYFGLRETTSGFGILLMFYAAVLLQDNCRGWRGFSWFGVAAGIMILSRGDMLPFVILACGAVLLLDWIRNRLPFRALLAGGVILLLVLPQLLYNYYQIGYPVPEVRHAVVLRSLTPYLPVRLIRNPHPRMPLDIEAVWEGGDND